ncbi:MAG: efflux RND transporter periplasmic adaptor subunit [Patescibacteria group bacterium]
MNEHLSRGYTFLHGGSVFLFKSIQEFFIVAKAHKFISLGVIVALIATTVGISFFFKAKPEGATDERRQVTLLSANDLSLPEPIALIGSIRSVSEANVAADVSGAVAHVYRSLGDTIGAGTVIADLKNDSQRAGVAQAEAALDKAKTGVTVSGIGLGSAQDSLTSAINSAKNTISTTYATLDDAVKKKNDSVFSNPNGSQPKFIVSTSNAQAVLNAESKRLAIQAVFTREENASTPTDASSALVELENLRTDVAEVRELLSLTVSALNKAITSSSVSDTAIASYRADVSLALSNVNGVASSINSAIENLKAKIAAVEVSTENLSGGASQNSDIRAAEANLQAARANLEKTVIRAPIGGTINRLDLEVGSFVNASVPVVYITNARGLEVVAFVSERDIGDIAVGAKAVIGKSIVGKVAKLASALDPVTKKAEVRISIPQDSSLVSGSSVSVTIARTAKTSTTSAPLTLPLSALKITPEGTVVFTVVNGTVVSHPVIVGALAGSRIGVQSGITPDMSIVEDARGLKEGQEVIVSE